MNYKDELMFHSVLSDNDIKKAMNSGAIFISPYEEQQLQPSGYNLTPTYFIYSVKEQRLLPLIKEDNKVYVVVDKNDMVLIRTRESVMVSLNITGEFNSKLRTTAIGFGHIATTLDPGWEGQLLISCNNPTNKKIKFIIEEKVNGKIIHNSFVTLTFYYMNSPASKISDNKSGRWDILDETIEKNNSVFKKNKVQSLRDIANKLKDKEKNNLESLILKVLDENEKNKYLELEDSKMFDDSYAERKSVFLNEVMKRHLRKIRKLLDEETEENIKIVNEYIEEKQRFLPIRYRIATFIWKHKYIFFGILLIIIMAIIQFILYKNDKENEYSIYVVLGSFAAYVLFPVLKDILNKILSNMN